MLRSWSRSADRVSVNDKTTVLIYAAKQTLIAQFCVVVVYFKEFRFFIHTHRLNGIQLVWFCATKLNLYRLDNPTNSHYGS